MLCLSISWGQPAEVVVGEAYSNSKRTYRSDFLGEHSETLTTAHYAYSPMRGRQLTVQQFHSSDLQLTNTVDIPPPEEREGTFQLTAFFHQKAAFYLFWTVTSTANGRRSLVVERLDASLQRTHLETVDQLATGERQLIQPSEGEDDGFLILHYQSDRRQDSPPAIDLIKIDSSVSVVWTATIQPPSPLYYLRVESVCFRRGSPIYLLCNYGFTPPLEEEKRGIPINNQYALWAYDHERAFLKEFELRPVKKWINGVAMSLNADRELIVSGYFNTSKKATIDGVFALKIDAQFRHKATHWDAFSAMTRQQLLRSRTALLKRQSDDKTLENYVLRNLEVLDDGTFFLLSEYYDYYTERVYNPQTNTSTIVDHHRYGTVVVNHFDQEGKHLWTGHIPKLQHTTTAPNYTSSFAVFNNGRELTLFFNDNEKNQGLLTGDGRQPLDIYDSRGAQIMHLFIRPEGIGERTALLDGRERWILNTPVSRQIAQSHIYLMTERSRRSRIVRFSN